MSGLGPDVTLLAQDTTLETISSTDEGDHDDEQFIGSLYWAGLSDTIETTPRIAASNFEEALTLLMNAGPGTDIIELCGGEDSRVMRIGI